MKIFKIWIACIAVLFGQLALGQSRNLVAYTDSLLLPAIDANMQDICDDTRPSFYYQRGIALYNLKDYRGAVGMYKLGLGKFPTDAMNLKFLANAYLALLDYPNALVSYEEALRYQEQLLVSLSNNPRLAAAGAEQSASQVFNGTLAEIHLGIATCKVHQMQFEDAFKAINKAILLVPNVVGFPKEKYYNMRGHIYLTKQEYQLALADFNKSIELNRDFAAAYVNRAIAKVNAVEKVKMANYSIPGDFGRQPLRISWQWPSSLQTKSGHSAVLSAWSDCNLALDKDTNYGFAYYIRGQIKHILVDSSYCADLLMAKQLGILVEEDLLADCMAN